MRVGIALSIIAVLGLTGVECDGSDAGLEFDAVLNTCVESVFNQTLAKQTAAFSSCASKSHTNTNYGLALNTYKRGVASGAISGMIIPRLQGLKDAEIRFNLEPKYSNPVSRVYEEARSQDLASTGKRMAELPDCVNSEFAAQVLELGKYCGKGNTALRHSAEYRAAFVEVCRLTRQKRKCNKLADDAYADFLLRFKDTLGGLGAL